MKRKVLSAGLLAGVIFLALPGVRSAMALGEQTIAVVVDSGTGGGVVIVCVKEAPGATDAQALSDALASQGLAAPTYSSSGLLCSIGATPANGCGVPTPSGYSYWAYFHGDQSGWHYASDGPAEHLASANLTEGWRYEVNGRGNPSDPTPDASSAPVQLCPAASPITTIPTPVATTQPAQLPASSSAPTSTTIPSSATAVSPASTTTAPINGSAGPEGGSKKVRPFSLAALHSNAPSALAFVALIALGVMTVAAIVISRRRRGHPRQSEDDVPG